METHAARSTSTKVKKLTSPPSRRSCAKRSPSTVLASRNLRRKRSPKGFRPGTGVAEVSFRPSVPGLKMASYLLRLWKSPIKYLRVKLLPHPLYLRRRPAIIQKKPNRQGAQSPASHLDLEQDFVGFVAWRNQREENAGDDRQQS